MTSKERYNQLLDEEADLVDALYDLELEEMDIANEDHWEVIQDAKRKAGKEYDAWWEANKEEYESLREQVYLNGY